MSERQRYKIIEKIDAGGMAEIYRAKAITVEGLSKDVAIKRILPSLCNRPKFVTMFLDEARLAMHLSHANIVQVFDVGRLGGTYYIVMELVEGPNLRRIFQRLTEIGQRFPVPIAVHIACEVLKGLAHAHERRDPNGNPLGIVHRDISPSNILISKAGEVKITDFGLAKAITQVEITDPGIVKGKFSYLSPEALDGKTVDHRADIFSLGIVLWELLANRRLFLGANEMETAEMVQKAEVPSLKLLNEEVPEELDRLVAKALARDPRKRYPTARDMGDALMGFLFAKNMKVSSYDLAEFVRSVFEAQAVRAEEENIERIGGLINEEILSLSMLRYAGQPLPVDGASAINVDAIPAGKAYRIGLEDLKSPSQYTGTTSSLTPTQSTALVEMLEGRETVPLTPVKGESEEWRKWVLLGLGGLIALGAMGYFIYRILL